MGLGDLAENVKDELNKFQDRTKIPITTILALVVFILLPGKITNLGKLGTLIKAIASAVEAVVKKNSRTFTPRQSTINLFNEFIDEHDFPHNKKYNTITWYYNANMPKIGGTSDQSAGAITFEDRIYFGSRPKCTVENIAGMFHEYVHTYQYKKYNQVVFAAVYVGNYLWNMIKNKFSDADQAYYDINFEKEAYAWQGNFARWLRQKDDFSADDTQNA
jgi:hypothetical protein